MRHGFSGSQFLDDEKSWRALRKAANIIDQFFDAIGDFEQQNLIRSTVEGKRRFARLLSVTAERLTIVADTLLDDHVELPDYEAPTNLGPWNLRFNSLLRLCSNSSAERARLQISAEIRTWAEELEEQQLMLVAQGQIQDSLGRQKNGSSFKNFLMRILRRLESSIRKIRNYFWTARRSRR
jgi:hypothetical protein